MAPLLHLLWLIVLVVRQLVDYQSGAQVMIIIIMVVIETHTYTVILKVLMANTILYGGESEYISAIVQDVIQL